MWPFAHGAPGFLDMYLTKSGVGQIILLRPVHFNLPDSILNGTPLHILQQMKHF
jgi:hypothetical protein